MKIGLIDVDGHRFPNLALMKLSAYHKTGGDAVEWCNRMETYDIVYMSKVFDETYTPDMEWNPISGTVMKGGTGYVRRVKEKGVSYIEFYRNGEWERYNPAVYDHTGTAYTVRGTREVYTEELPWHIEHIYPDYSLYPELTKDTAYGYLTRGCPGRCPFCLVSQKEGDVSIKSSDLWNFWDGQKYIKLMDPNILACVDHINLLGQLADSKAYVDFTQGLDIRRVNEDNIDLINAIKVKEIHFAWDNPKEDLTERFRWYAEHAKHRPNGAYGTVYTLVNYWSDLEEDLYRIYTLQDMGYDPYVMIYDKPGCDRVYIDLQRWCNRPAIRKKCPDFADYKKAKPDERQVGICTSD